MTREIHVHAGWLARDSHIGILHVTPGRGREVFAFEYSRAWLAHRDRPLIDPELRLLAGHQFFQDRERVNFGVFLDSAPDRWGRTLMNRREAIAARRETRRPRPLLESDYLLGVHDLQRMGGLRLALSPDGPFLSNDPEMAAPPWTSLRTLEAACWKVQDENSTDDVAQEKWLKLLMAPGSSLGGARPKCGVADPQGALWIAKFPARSDDHDHAAWEMLVHQLAVSAGLRVPEARLEKLTRRHRTFLVRRFDRGAAGARIHFASAMTMLSRGDGADAAAGASYLYLAEFIQRHSHRPADDLEELWQRIAFSVFVSNTDDHLRNHGFLLTARGWELAPAFDLNADPQGAGLSLNITEHDNSLNPDLLRETAPHFRIPPRRADAILSRIRKAVAAWRDTAVRLEIPRSEQQRMAPAFHPAAG
jgi:serine/threonine-protein kinase HipA